MTLDPELIRFQHRGVATMITFGLVNAAVVGTAVAHVALPAMVAVGTMGLLAAAYEALRYIVTESAITRVSLLWGTRDASATASSARPVLGSGPGEPLRAGAVPDAVRARRLDE